MADKRAYFKVDVGYFTNPKVATILAQSPIAAILHLESIAYAAQHLTDGKVPKILAMRLVGATDDDAALLMEAGVWLPTDQAGVIEVKDYLEHQRSAAEVKKLSEAGRKAATSRWQSDSDADGNAGRMRNPMPREKEREREEKPAKPRKRGLPADWTPNAAALTFAKEKRIDADREAFKFRNHAASTGRTLIDWDRAFLNWLDKSLEYAPRTPQRSATDMRPEGW